MTDDLEAIHSDSDWLDLRCGEFAILRGKLHNPQKGASTLLVTLPDWSDLVVEITDTDGLSKEFPKGSRVKIIVERTLDGIQTQTDRVDVEAVE